MSISEILQYKRELIPLSFSDEFTINDYVNIVSNGLEPAAKRKAAFGLISQQYRREINLEYPKS